MPGVTVLTNTFHENKELSVKYTKNAGANDSIQIGEWDDQNNQFNYGPETSVSVNGQYDVELTSGGKKIVVQIDVSQVTTCTRLLEVRADQVWNHAIFRYTARFKEVTGADAIDETYIEITNTIEGNADAPFNMKEDKRVSRVYTYRLQFGTTGHNKGKPLTNANQNWMYVKSRAGTTGYMPPENITKVEEGPHTRWFSMAGVTRANVDAIP